MATTTNYSWSTPDDTALVKDGAAAIRSLGTAIDTTVFTNAGAAIAKATVDAKGDLIAGTADNTVARLAVGANDTILVADSSTATGLKWAAPAGGGKVLQVIQGSDSTARSRTATSFASANVAATITPSSATSTILAIATLSDVYQGGGSSMKLRIVRGATEIIKFGSNNGYSNVAGNPVIYMGSNSISYLDSPATTSATTYTVEFASMQSGTAVGMSGADATSTITLLEIGA